MADRKNFYFNQGLKEEELDAAFDGVENALWNVVKDLKLYGLAAGGAVTADPGDTECTVGAFLGYDKLGRRLYLATDLVVDYSTDTLGAATVPSSGQYRWITIVARFGRNTSDSRTDGAGASLKFTNAEALVSTGDSTAANVGKLQVLSGVQNAVAANAVRPAAGANDVIVADLLLSDTGIALAADVSTARTDRLVYRSSAAPGSSTSYDGSTRYVLFHETMADGDYGAKVRMYGNGGGALVITTNAQWNGVTQRWTADSGLYFGMKLTFGQASALRLERRTDVGSPWTDQEHNAAGWDGKFEISQGVTDGFVEIDGKGEILGDGVTSALWAWTGAKVAGGIIYGGHVNFRRKLLAAPSSATFSTPSGWVDLNVSAGPASLDYAHEEGAVMSFTPTSNGPASICRLVTTIV